MSVPSFIKIITIKPLGVNIHTYKCFLVAAGRLVLAAMNSYFLGVYTPLKRHHIFCTWAGAVVGAIPPLMGYAAAGNLALPGFVIGALVYFWQFPHFNGLSWALRGEYTRAGYRVMCVLDERLCKASSLRYFLKPLST